MNKVLNINLGGLPFVIDQEAYKHLSNYLETIEHHFRSSEGYEEITSDIEARMAELFEDNLGKRKIITLNDVEEAIATMGTPEEFGAEPIHEENKFGQSSYRTGKKLFRDPDDQVIAGVCSGVASYFGIGDPVWVRLAFVLALFSGFGVLLYIILWAIVPEAQTSADRLSMRGENVNISNMAKIIEDEIENFTDKLSDMGSSKKKEKERERKTRMNRNSRGSTLTSEPPLRKGFHC